jgi:hypothetical protein
MKTVKIKLKVTKEVVMSNASASKKNIMLGFIMFFSVLLIATVTYFTVFHFFSPKMLNAPQNVLVHSEEGEVILSWDKVDNASWYSLHLLNRTNGSELSISIYPVNYTINEYNKVEYNLTSDISLISNYSIIIRAMSEDENLNNSNFCEPYEFEQVDRSADVIPLNN